MDTYIVRIYRRTSSSAPEPVGTVERIGSGERVGFAGRKELLDQLLAPQPPNAAEDRGDPPIADKTARRRR